MRGSPKTTQSPTAGMPLISLDDDDQRWVPTHVNVTVLRARSLRTKGKQGSRYLYTIIQVGKEKYTTGLVEKADEPQWNEECAFELPPGLLEAAGTSAYPPGSSNLVLTVMHRVLIGLDVFLGKTVVPLDKVFQEGTCPRNEWLKLHSKSGRKEKERGELQVTIQFTRNNMTASMYDLTVKDKPRSAFGKLKDRVTGRKRGDVESSSAILPGRYAALSGSVGPPFASDDGAQEPGEEDGVDEHRSKVKDFFLKGKLRKNSDTRSCSSLASDSSMASSTGDPFVPVELSRTPVYSSRVMEPFSIEDKGGIKVMTHKRAHSDEASKITGIPRPNPATETLKGQSTTLSQSTICINGSHIYSSEPVSPKSPSTIPAKRSLLEKCAPLSRSLQNLTRRGEDSQRSFSTEKSKKEDGEADGSVSQTTPEEKLVQATGPQTASGVMEVVDKGKKLRKTLFSSGRSDSLPAKPEQGQVSASLEGRRRGWFGSGDSHSKPRLGVSPKVESSSNTNPSPALSCPPIQPPCTLPIASMSPPSGDHSNPFTCPSPTPPSMSPTNPFLTRLQQNPFFEDLIAEEALKSPTAVYCSPNGMQNKMSVVKRERPRSMARQRSLPTIVPETPDTYSNSNTNANYSLSERVGECDDFETFAIGRLKSPTATPTRPPSAPFLSRVPNLNQMVHVGNSRLRVDEVDMDVPKPWDIPPLPPRRPVRNQVTARERFADSWLDRAQELAVQKEACVLFQTDFASLQHVREGDMKRNVSCHTSSDKRNSASLGTELHGGLLEVGEERMVANAPCSKGPTFDLMVNNVSHNSPNGLVEDSLHSHYSEPETLCFPSDFDTTVTESLCSSPQTQLKHDSESSCEIDPKQKASTEQKQTTNDIGLLTIPPRDSNNNMDSTAEFAYIDSESSASDVQPLFEINKDGSKPSKGLNECPNLNFSGSLPKYSPGMPEDVSSKKTRKDITSHVTDSSDHNSLNRLFQRSREGLERDAKHCNTISNCESHCEVDVLQNKEISVVTQTTSALGNDDIVTTQIKPGSAETNDIIHSSTHDGEKVHEQTCKHPDHHANANLTTEVCLSKASETEEFSLTQDKRISFEDLHAKLAPKSCISPNVKSARIRPRSPKSASDLILHDLSPSPLPVACTPACLHPDPSLHVNPPNEMPSMGSTSFTKAQPQVDAPLPLSPEETQPANVLLPLEESSPHPVKPLTNTTMQGEKKPESRSVLEKLKSTINPGRSVQPTSAEDEKTQLALMEAQAQYQNMTNMELIALLLQQEMDVRKQRAETELQVALLEKRDAELKKMKAQVRDLEDYIDKLLVRIMEQTPTLLQVRARPK